VNVVQVQVFLLSSVDSGINIDLFWTEEDEKLQQKRIKEQEGELE
jgi:hypothetical protein